MRKSKVARLSAALTLQFALMSFLLPPCQAQQPGQNQGQGQGQGAYGGAGFYQQAQPAPGNYQPFQGQQAPFPGFQGGQPYGQNPYNQGQQGLPEQGLAGQMPPGQLPNSQGQIPQVQKVSPQQAAKIYNWFLSYDEIRRRAQMNPIEKQKSDGLLARGLGLFMAGPDKLAAKQLLGTLAERYQGACQSLRKLAPLPETKELQGLYFQYFEAAMFLFTDYLKVQDNIFAVDNTGQSIAKQLIQRKLALENLEHSCKELDSRARQVYGIAPYQY